MLPCYLISYDTCCMSNKHILFYNRAFRSVVKGLQGKGNFAILIQYDFLVMKFRGAYVCGLSCREGVVCVTVLICVCVCLVVEVTFQRFLHIVY